jgi:hypothetical protein
MDCIASLDTASLDDVVLFELPASGDAEAFCDRLRPRWTGWSHADSDVWLFTADLAGDDLALLLREAQELVADLGLAAIRFYLDGRVYLLEAAPRPGSARITVLHPRSTG